MKGRDISMKLFIKNQNKALILRKYCRRDNPGYDYKTTYSLEYEIT